MPPQSVIECLQNTPHRPLNAILSSCLRSRYETYRTRTHTYTDPRITDHRFPPPTPDPTNRRHRCCASIRRCHLLLQQSSGSYLFISNLHLQHQPEELHAQPSEVERPPLQNQKASPVEEVDLVILYTDPSSTAFWPWIRRVLCCSSTSSGPVLLFQIKHYLPRTAATHQSRHHGSVHLWAGLYQIEDKPYRVGVRRAARGRRQSRAGPALGKINLILSSLPFYFARAARHSHTAELMAPQSQGKLTSCWPLAASGSTRNRSVRKEAPP